MKIKLYIPIKPLSDNRKHVPSRGRLIKTPEARKFQKDMEMYLSFKKADIGQFKAAYSPVMCVSATYVYFIPRNKFYTKEGKISKTGGDATNFVKMTQDALFDYMGINDANVVNADVFKVPSDEYGMRIELELKTLDYIKVLESRF